MTSALLEAVAKPDIRYSPRLRRAARLAGFLKVASRADARVCERSNGETPLPPVLEDGLKLGMLAGGRPIQAVRLEAHGQAAVFYFVGDEDEVLDRLES
jgi:hypothetical protein